MAPKWDDEARDRSQRRGSFGSAYRRDANSRVVYSDDTPVAAPVAEPDPAPIPSTLEQRIRVVRSFSAATWLVANGLEPRVEIENGKQAWIFDDTTLLPTGRLMAEYVSWKQRSDAAALAKGGTAYQRGRG